MSKQLAIYQRSKQETQTISNLHLWHGDPLLLKVSGSYGGIWVEEYGRRGVWNRGTRDFNLYVHVQVTIEAKEGAYILQALIFFFFHTNVLSPLSLSCPLRISGEGSGEWPLEEVWLGVSTGRSKFASALGRVQQLYNLLRILSKRLLTNLRQLATSQTPEYMDTSG